MLTAFNGETITYDEIGNPLQYYNGYVFTWEQGRRLDTVSQDGSLVASYKYNDDGIRTSKTTQWSEYKYILNGTQIVAEMWDDCINIYLYDEYGSPIGFLHRYANMAQDTYRAYFYEKNIFGDIIAIYDTSGVKQVSYTYDAFGYFKRSIHVSGARARYNNLLYRGYYFDWETGFYYLNSRYYDPLTCRFINADGYVSTGQGLTGYNMFAYCGNNPVMRVDPNGEGFLSIFVAIVAVVVAVASWNNAVAEINEIYDSTPDKTGTVENQGEIDKPFGFSTVKGMGCGAVAVHNSIVLSGGESSLNDVTRYLTSRDLLFGRAGAYFWNMTSYLESKGYGTETYFGNPENIDNFIRNSTYKVGILAYSTGPFSGHYVAIKYTDNGFDIYNTGGTKKMSHQSMDGYLRRTKLRYVL